VSTARDRAQAEWARVQERTADRSRVQQWNDVALEAAIFAARLGSAAGVGTLAPLVPLSVVVNDWRYYAAVVLWAAVVFAGGWWGWWYYGNAEWRRKPQKGKATDAGQ